MVKRDRGRIGNRIKWYWFHSLLLFRHVADDGERLLLWAKKAVLIAGGLPMVAEYTPVPQVRQTQKSPAFYVRHRFLEQDNRHQTLIGSSRHNWSVLKIDEKFLQYPENEKDSLDGRKSIRTMGRSRSQRGGPVKLYRLDRRQNFSVSLEEAWRFFSSPKNLPAITPPSLSLRIVGDVTEPIYPGMIIPYRVAPLLGISIDWITEITHVRAPRYFVDEQRLGPYRFWHHEHHLRPLNSGVEMIDTVHYCLKFGPIGRLLHGLFIRTQLEEIFDFRYKKLEQLFPNPRRA
jgi:ligand-binding SRPBCC domain-containing protein